MASEDMGATSLKGAKLRNHLTDFKLEAVEYSEKNGNKAASRHFKVASKTVRC